MRKAVFILLPWLLLLPLCSSSSSPSDDDVAKEFGAHWCGGETSSRLSPEEIEEITGKEREKCSATWNRSWKGDGNDTYYELKGFVRAVTEKCLETKTNKNMTELTTNTDDLLRSKEAGKCALNTIYLQQCEPKPIKGKIFQPLHHVCNYYGKFTYRFDFDYKCDDFMDKCLANYNAPKTMDFLLSQCEIGTAQATDCKIGERKKDDPTPPERYTAREIVNKCHPQNTWKKGEVKCIINTITQRCESGKVNEILEQACGVITGYQGFCKDFATPCSAKLKDKLKKTTEAPATTTPPTTVPSTTTAAPTTPPTKAPTTVITTHITSTKDPLTSATETTAPPTTPKATTIAPTTKDPTIYVPTAAPTTAVPSPTSPETKSPTSPKTSPSSTPTEAPTTPSTTEAPTPPPETTTTAPPVVNTNGPVAPIRKKTTPRPILERNTQEQDEIDQRKKDRLAAEGKAKAKEEDEGTNLVGLWVTLAVVIVVGAIVGVVVTVVVRRRAKKKKEAAESALKSTASSKRNIGGELGKSGRPPPPGPKGPKGAAAKKPPAKNKAPALAMKQMEAGVIDNKFKFDGPLTVDVAIRKGQKVEHATGDDDGKEIDHVIFDHDLNKVVDIGSNIEKIETEELATVTVDRTDNTVEGPSRKGRSKEKIEKAAEKQPTKSTERSIGGPDSSPGVK